MEIYRFRTAYGLLDGYHELEKQEIYFASPGELNDPMEGFRDIFWRGDEIVWQNLLKKYVYCLEHIYTLLIVASDKLTLTADDIPLYNWPEPNVPYKRLLMREEIRKKFFGYQIIKELPAQLQMRTSPVRRHELLSYLMIAQSFALAAIEEVYSSEALINTKTFPQKEEHLKELIARSAALPTVANQLEKDNPNGVIALEAFFQITNLYRQSVTLANSSPGSTPKMLENRLFVINEFDEAFVDKLEKLTYPDWYSASFLTNCRNSAIWGHYGDNHKGVCLIYEPTEKDDKMTIDLHVPYGANSQGITYGMRPQEFRKINYDQKHISIDFFKSLGQATTMFLNANWYKNDAGDLSPLASHLTENSEAWRQNYWDNFKESLFIKVKEWEYEQEYRLTLDGHFHDYEPKDSRKIRYNFSALKGIIFGLKTSKADKVKIISIIKAKCAKENRKDFEFYQAYYSQTTRQIERQRLSLITI